MKRTKKNIRSDYIKKYITRTYVCQLGYYLFFGKTTLLLLCFPGLQIGSDTVSDRYRFFLRVLHAFPAQ